MRSTFNGRNRGKSVSFRPSTEESFGGDRRELSDREDFNKIDVEEPRTVKLLPDANMTISVHNDFRDSSSNVRPYGNQSNSSREESNFNFPNNRNSHYSNRGFESYISKGRGRGSPKGYSQGQSYDYEYVNYQDSNNQRYYRNESYDNHYDGRQSSNSYNQRYNTGHGYQQSDQRSNRSWPSSSKYEIDGDNQKERSDKRTFRGYNKSGNDRPRRSRGVRGYSRVRSFKDNEEGTNACLTGDGNLPQEKHKNETENESPWLEEEVYQDSKNAESSNANVAKSDNEVKGDTVTDEIQICEKEMEFEEVRSEDTVTEEINTEDAHSEKIRIDENNAEEIEDEHSETKEASGVKEEIEESVIENAKEEEDNNQQTKIENVYDEQKNIEEFSEEQKETKSEEVESDHVKTENISTELSETQITEEDTKEGNKGTEETNITDIDSEVKVGEQCEDSLQK